MRFPVAREGMSSQKAAEGKNQNVTGGNLNLNAPMKGWNKIASKQRLKHEMSL